MFPVQNRHRLHSQHGWNSLQTIFIGRIIFNENHYICNNSNKNYARILKIGYVVHDTFVLDCIKSFFYKKFYLIF